MACNACDGITPETIKNCWNHTGIQHNPIILCVPLTLTQRGWNMIHMFANSSSGMTLPQAEDSLKIFGDQYNNNWWPALKIITKMEPNKDMHSSKPSRKSPIPKINLLSLLNIPGLQQKSYLQLRNLNKETEYLKVPQVQMPISSQRLRKRWSQRLELKIFGINCQTL